MSVLYMVSTIVYSKLICDEFAGGATLIFDTELVAVNGQTSSEGKTETEL